MLAQLKTALFMTLLLTVLTGLIYPFGVTALAQVLFHEEANGSLITRNGNLIGSKLIGQNFTSPEYFHGRPSAAGVGGYDATASGGSNLGPRNPTLAKRLNTDSRAYRTANGVDGPLPADAVTASASGLDPEISPANALLQVERVARARHSANKQVEALVRSRIQDRDLAVLGEPRVNVLELNLALDESFPLQR
jgi:potassium-transporting ATPase KdpC subunit